MILTVEFELVFILLFFQFAKPLSAAFPWGILNEQMLQLSQKEGEWKVVFVSQLLWFVSSWVETTPKMTVPVGIKALNISIIDVVSTNVQYL